MRIRIIKSNEFISYFDMKNMRGGEIFKPNFNNKIRKLFMDNLSQVDTIAMAVDHISEQENLKLN